MLIPVDVEMNDDILFLFYLCHICRLDFPYFCFLYQKLGKDVFYVFYLCSGRKFRFPTQKKLEKLPISCEKLKDKLFGKKIEFKTQQENTAYELLKETYNPINNKLTLSINLEEEEEDVIQKFRKNLPSDKKVSVK